MAHTWIIAVEPNISHLVALGRAIGGEVNAVVVGDASVAGVDRVVRIALDESVPAEAGGPAVTAALSLQDGDVVLAANNPAERVLAGAVAGMLQLPFLSGVRDLGAGSASLSKFGGIANETVSFTSPVVAVVDGGQLVEGEQPPEEQGDKHSFDMKVIGQELVDLEEVDLVSAKRIVAAGRGFKTKEDLRLAEELAGVLGAEVACSRPLAEGAEWLQRDRYIGVSGQHVNPELYVAVGISGQIQHTVGMSESDTIIAVNSDENAPIFGIADYGIVGDLYEVLPALTQGIE